MTETGGAAVERWCAGLSRWPRLGLAMLAGAVMTAGHPPVGVPWGWFLAMPLLVWLLAGAPSARAAAWTGWAAGFGYFVTGLHWIGNAFLVDPDQFLLLMPLGVIGLPAGLAVFWALAFWAAKRMIRGGSPGWHMAMALAAMLGLVELARGYVLTGFPWALPAYIWLDTPLMQTSAWFGPFTLSVLTLLMTAMPMVTALRGERAKSAAAAFVLAALWIGGEIDAAPAPPPEGHDPLTIRLVQPNAPQHLKWQPGLREEFYRRLLEGTAAPADTRPDVVIWPEIAVHFVPSENPSEMARIAEAANGVPVILGAFYRDGPDFISNALQVILPDGTLGPVYHKHHLVPFGEYMPLVWILGELGLPDFSEGIGFTRGAGPMTLKVPGLPPFSPNICYESIFPYEVVGPDRPDWIVQITNDAWFGSYAGPQQHLAQARFRAVEQGLPVIRATNTGISAVIDATGAVVGALQMHNYGYIDVNLPNNLPPTPYSIVGDISCILLLAGLLFLIFLSRLRFG